MTGPYDFAQDGDVVRTDALRAQRGSGGDCAFYGAYSFTGSARILAAMSRPPKLPDTCTPDKYPATFALFEAVQGTATAGKRIKPANKFALCLTITGEEGTTRAAAKATASREQVIYNLRSSEHGKKFIKEAERAFLKGEGTKAVGRIVKISRQDENLAQAMRANEWLTGVNGLSPTKKHEIAQTGGAPQIGMMVIHPDALPDGALDALIPLPKDSKSPPHEPQVIEHEGE